jgi:hypothetical protein
MGPYLPQNNTRINVKNTDQLLPLVTSKKDNNWYCQTYNRYDPSTLLINPQNIQNIIFPDYNRGGLDSTDYSKQIWGTQYQNTIRFPINQQLRSITAESVASTGKDVPMNTYLKK